jgi:hypothetical protein
MDKNSSIVRVECPMVSTDNLAEELMPATISAAATISRVATDSAAAGFVFAGATRLLAILAAFVLFLGVTLAPRSANWRDI